MASTPAVGGDFNGPRRPHGRADPIYDPAVSLAGAELCEAAGGVERAAAVGESFDLIMAGGRRQVGRRVAAAGGASEEVLASPLTGGPGPVLGARFLNFQGKRFGRAGAIAAEALTKLEMPIWRHLLDGRTGTWRHLEPPRGQPSRLLDRRWVIPFANLMR